MAMELHDLDSPELDLPVQEPKKTFQVKSLQTLCLENLVKHNHSSYSGMNNVLPISLLRLYIAEYEKQLYVQSYRATLVEANFFSISYCHPKRLIGMVNCRYNCEHACEHYQEATYIDFYYSKLICDMQIERLIYRNRHNFTSNYNAEIYGPDHITFTTPTDRSQSIANYHYVSVCANISTKSISTSNFPIVVPLVTYGIVSNRTMSMIGQLDFIFINGTCCGSPIRSDGKHQSIGMSYIALDNNMEYIGHKFVCWDAKKNKAYNAQIKALVEKRETSSSLPFFILFLEHVRDPIKRLIYMLTYMPSLHVRSGK